MTRREVENLIAEGKAIIIVNQHVLKVDPWIKYHPGGDKSIAHEIGRDATDEVTVYVLLQQRSGAIDSDANVVCIVSTRPKLSR